MGWSVYAVIDFLKIQNLFLLLKNIFVTKTYFLLQNIFCSCLIFAHQESGCLFSVAYKKNWVYTTILGYCGKLGKESGFRESWRMARWSVAV